MFQVFEYIAMGVENFLLYAFFSCASNDLGFKSMQEESV